MLKSKSSIKAKFNKSFASSYFFFESLTYFFRAKIISQSSSLKGKKVLDVCCGTGVNSLIMAKQDADVIGIDLSKDQISFANLRKNKYPSLKLDFKVVDAESLKFKTNSFDIVFCSFGLHELGAEKVLQNVIKQVKRVLKPNGKFIVFDFNKPKKKNAILIFMQKIHSHEPLETLKIILNNSITEFAKKYNLKPIKEKIYFFNLLKLWSFEK